MFCEKIKFYNKKIYKLIGKLKIYGANTDYWNG